MLPKLDKLVDATTSHALLSFVDAIPSYHRISLHESDQEKTTFITDRGLYCYKVRPFNLKMRERPIRGWLTRCSTRSPGKIWSFMWMI